MSTLRNHVQLLGFLGNDPELRTTTTGKKVANFRIATSESYKDASGQWQTESTWHTISCWEALAERVQQQLKKGSYVVLQGKLTYNKYTDSNNIERTVAEIRMDNFILLDRNSKTSEDKQHNNNDTINQQEFADDLPF